MSVRLYAVVRLRRKSGSLPAGLDGERLQLLKWGSARIVFAEARAVEPTPVQLLAFDRIIRNLAAASAAILPARFGVVAENAAQLKEELEERAEVLERALDVVAGREQMTLRVSAGSARNPGHFGPGGRSPGKNYLQALAAAAPENAPKLSALRKLLANVVRAERVDAHPGSVAVYHLIAKGDAPKYRALVRKNAGGDLRVSGPFPPYAFVPGIDHAIWLKHDDRKNTSKTGLARPRPRRRSSRNAHG